MADKPQKEQRKFQVFTWVVAAIFALLILRLFFLQIVNAQIYAEQATSNYTRLITQPARRGDISDKQGRVLVTSQPVFVVSIVRLQQEPPPETLDLLAELLGDPEITATAIAERLASAGPKYRPVEIKRLPWSPATLQVIARLEEHREELPSVEITTEPMRYYPYGGLAGHVLGYVGNISKEELETYQEYEYGINDVVGKSGLEKIYEHYTVNGREIGLRGQRGFRQVVADAYQRPIGEIVNVPPLPGNNLVLTMDLDLQQALEQSMEEVIAGLQENNPGAGGAAGVVLDVRTGAILAMASKPDLNPGDFVDGLDKTEQAYYNDHPLRPYTNRAVQGTYPPGSTFKMITGMAALEEGVLTPSDTITCPGYYWVKPYIACWKVHGSGVNLYRGLGESCNTYFQNAGYLAGIEAIDRVAREFGLGVSTGSRDILGEAAGVLPTPEWKKEYYTAYYNDLFPQELAKLEEKYSARLAAAGPEEKAAIQKQYENDLARLKADQQIRFNFDTQWQIFDTLNTSIGQGVSSYTMLQLANYVATLANGGRRMRPYLVQKIVSPSGETLATFGPEEIQQVQVSARTMAEVRQGMLAVTQPGGTAYSVFRDFPPEIKIAGKTGTAQTGRRDARGNELQHGLFVSFAPFDAPQLAVAVVIEYGESGSGSAARVVKGVYETYFGLRQPEKEISSLSPSVRN